MACADDCFWEDSEAVVWVLHDDLPQKDEEVSASAGGDDFLWEVEAAVAWVWTNGAWVALWGSHLDSKHGRPSRLWRQVNRRGF